MAQVHSTNLLRIPYELTTHFNKTSGKAAHFFLSKVKQCRILTKKLYPYLKLPKLMCLQLLIIGKK